MNSALLLASTLPPPLRLAPLSASEALELSSDAAPPPPPRRAPPGQSESRQAPEPLLRRLAAGLLEAVQSLLLAPQHCAWPAGAHAWPGGPHAVIAPSVAPGGADSTPLETLQRLGLRLSGVDAPLAQQGGAGPRLGPAPLASEGEGSGPSIAAGRACTVERFRKALQCRYLRAGQGWPACPW